MCGAEVGVEGQKERKKKRGERHGCREREGDWYCHNLALVFFLPHLIRLKRPYYLQSCESITQDCFEVLSLCWQLFRENLKWLWTFRPVLTLKMCLSLWMSAMFPARIGKMKRRKPEEGGQVCPLCSAPLAGSEEEMSRHVEQCLIQVVHSRPWTPPTASRTAYRPFTSCRCCPVTFCRSVDTN